MGLKAENLKIIDKELGVVPIFLSFEKGKNDFALNAFLSNTKKETYLYAVRSNSSDEDGLNKTNAGKYTSLLFVRPDELENAINEVYKTSNGVIIQDMILDPEISGVAYISEENQVFHLAEGLCSGITSGKVLTYDIHMSNFNHIYKKNELEIPNVNLKTIYNGKEIEEVLIEESSVLEGFNIFEYIDIFKNIYKLFDYSVCEIEFSIKDNKLYCLQCRKIQKKENLCKVH